MPNVDWRPERLEVAPACHDHGMPLDSIFPMWSLFNVKRYTYILYMGTVVEKLQSLSIPRDKV